MAKLDVEAPPDAVAGEKQEIKYRGIKAMPFVIGNETFEKLGTIGTSSNLLVYLTTVFHMKSITATNLVNIFNGSGNLATLIGAFLSDTYFGRYNTLGFASVSSFLGMVVLTLTAAIHVLHPPKSSCPSTHSCSTTGPSTGRMTFLIFGLVLLIIGAGGIRPCNLAFGADQFNPKTESGKRGINSFFNWYYFTFTFAMMISMTFIVYVQTDVSWAIGLAIPAAMMFLSCLMFFVGTKLYVRMRPEGSPLLTVAQVIVAAFKKRSFKAPECCDDHDHAVAQGLVLDHVSTNSINSKLPFTEQFRFLNKASIITKEDQINPDGSSTNPWNLCTVQQVEQVKCLARILPIWVSAILYGIVQITLQNYVVLQAIQSNRRLGSTHFQIPEASYNFFTMLAVTIWIPIYDRALVPLLRSRTHKDSGITVLQKIGVGIVISVLTMLMSAIVEHKRRELALTGHMIGSMARKGVSSLSASWLVPQLVLVGISEAFTMVGLVEFYYKQVPENMKSIGGSFVFSGMAISAYLSSSLISLVHKMTSRGGGGKGTDTEISWLSEDLNQGRLDYFYYLIAALELLNVVYFLACATWYQYKITDIDHPDVSGKENDKPSIKSGN